MKHPPIYFFSDVVRILGIKPSALSNLLRPRDKPPLFKPAYPAGNKHPCVFLDGDIDVLADYFCLRNDSDPRVRREARRRLRMHNT